MEHWIEHPPEPRELLLAWQAPPTVPDRLRWAVGRLVRFGDEGAFDYLNDTEFRRLNGGRTQEALREAGYVGYPAFDLKKRPPQGFRENVLEAFLRRLPPSDRADFPSYLAHHRMRETTKISRFALLAITEATLPSDGFSLIDPLDESASVVDIIFEVAGFRHFDNRGIRVGDPVYLEPEPLNAVDSQAVKVTASGRCIGYVNRLQAATIRKWLEQRRTACWVARLNGRSGSPKAHAFLQVRPAQIWAAA